MNRMFFAAITLVLLTTGTTLGQQRWQADIMVQQVTVKEISGQLRATVTVFNFNDDTARHATLMVLLPVETQYIKSTNDQCTASVLRSNLPTHGVVQCALGDMNVGASQTIEIVTTVPPASFSGITKTFGAFVWSLSPDPRPGNNYGEFTAP